MITEIDSDGFPKIVEEIDLSSVFVAGTDSGNPFHNAFSGRFDFAPPGVSIMKGTNLIRNLSTASRRLLFNRTKTVQANQLSAQIIDGDLHIVLLRDGRRLDSFAIQPEAERKRQAKDAEGTGEGGRGAAFSLEGAGRDALIDAARQFDLKGDKLKKFLEARLHIEIDPKLLQEIEQLVQNERLNMLIDYLHQNLLRTERGDRQEKAIKIRTFRGFERKAFSNLTEEEAVEVLSRLQQRGWTEAVIQDRVATSLPQRLRKIIHIESKEEKPESSSSPAGQDVKAKTR